MYENVQQRHNPFAKNIAHVKDYFKSPLVLIIACFSIITLIVSIIAAANSSSMANTVASLLYQLDIIDRGDYYDLVNNVGFNLAFALPGIIMGILTVVGYIVIFAKSRTSNPDSTPNAGFSLCYAASIIQLITNIIICVSAVVANFALWINYIDTEDSKYISNYRIFISSREEKMLITCIIVTFVLVLAVILLLSYAITQLNFFRAPKSSMNGPTLRYEGAKGFGVTSIMFAILYFAYFIFLIVYLNSFSFYRFNGALFWAFALIFVYIALYIFQAVLALGYRGHAYRINSSNTSYPQPSYAAPAQPYATPYGQPYPQQQYGQPYPQQPHSQPYVQQPYNQPASPTYVAPAQPETPTYTTPAQPAVEANEQATQVEADAPTKVIPEKNTCPQCGSTYEEDSLFCESCGHKLN